VRTLIKDQTRLNQAQRDQEESFYEELSRLNNTARTGQEERRTGRKAAHLCHFTVDSIHYDFRKKEYVSITGDIFAVFGRSVQEILESKLSFFTQFAHPDDLATMQKHEPIGISLGIATAIHQQPLSHLLVEADNAMYQDKAQHHRGRK
jgi:hypothetical protein